MPEFPFAAVVAILVILFIGVVIGLALASVAFAD